MPYADTLKVFEVLRQEFDEKKAAKIAEAIESALETNNDTLIEKMQLIFRKELADVKADIIKWMFIFWAGQGVVIYGLLKLIR